MQVILIGGKARSGKDTIADFMYDILEQEGKKVCKIQIGQYIKYYATRYCGWDGREETKPRDLLLKIGTEIIREKIDPEFHIDRLIQDIRVLSYFYDYFIVSDVRLPNEIEKPKSNFENVCTIRMERYSDELNSAQKQHITEVALDNYDGFDFIINNDGTLEELEEKAKDILKKIGG